MPNPNQNQIPWAFNTSPSDTGYSSTEPHYAKTGAQAGKDPYGIADMPYGAPTKDRSIAQYQLAEHVAAAQNMGQLQAARRGFNPLMARAATQSGAELGSMAQGEMQSLARQEELARRQGLAAQQAGLTAAQMQQLGLETGKLGMQSQQTAFQQGLQNQVDVARAQRAEELGLGIGQMLTAPLALLSDENAKMNIRPAGAEADKLLDKASEFDARSMLRQAGAEPENVGASMSEYYAVPGYASRMVALEKANMPIGASADRVAMSGEYDNPANPRTAMVYMGELPKVGAKPVETVATTRAAAEEAKPMAREDVIRGVKIENLGEGGPDNRYSYGQVIERPAARGTMVMPTESVVVERPLTDAQRKMAMERLGMPTGMSAEKSAQAQRVIEQQVPRAAAFVASPGGITDEEYGFATPVRAAAPAPQMVVARDDQAQRMVAQQMPKATRFVESVAEGEDDYGAASPEYLLRKREADRRAQQYTQALEQTNAKMQAQLNRPQSQRDQELAQALAGLGSQTSQKLQAGGGIKPVNFQYRPGMGQEPGQQFGVIAQDLVGTPMEQALTPTPHGLAIDSRKAVGPMFGALGRLNQRLKKLEGK